ncbi:MAG: hypothetical protein JW768_00160 [Chitinispirillaceae bacterium]|nr:hypothetical protein [Chitinispirillaceae bacterium]
MKSTSNRYKDAATRNRIFIRSRGNQQRISGITKHGTRKKGKKGPPENS